MSIVQRTHLRTGRQIDVDPFCDVEFHFINDATDLRPLNEIDNM